VVAGEPRDRPRPGRAERDVDLPAVERVGRVGRAARRADRGVRVRAELRYERARVAEGNVAEDGRPVQERDRSEGRGSQRAEVPVDRDKEAVVGAEDGAVPLATRN